MQNGGEIMKKHSIVNVVKAVAFLLIAMILFCCLSKVLERKRIYGAGNMMAKMNEFYSTTENSMSYIGVGSSHMYCTLNPLEVWKKTGISGFVVSSQQQPLNASYHYLKEAFKTQNPDVVIVEGYMGYYEEEYPKDAVAYDAIDPLRLSWNKIQLINEIVPEGERVNYYFNILKYHTRWKEISFREVVDSFNQPVDTYKGYVCLAGSEEFSINESNYDSVGKGVMPEKNLQELEEIYQLIQENKADMILLIAPYPTDDEMLVSAMKAEIAWAQSKNVPVIDITSLYDELKINGATDFYDAGHLDVDGARKVSLYMADYLKDMGVAPRENIDSEKWQSNYETYIKYMEQIKERAEV